MKGIVFLTIFAAILLVSSGCGREEAAPEAGKQPGSGKSLTRAARGEEVYRRACSGCHDVGLLGAARLGDKAAWAGKIAKGTDLMIRNAIHGIGQMPPKGGNPSLNEEDVGAAVHYMIGKSR